MPIYEYQCNKCGKIEEAFQKYLDKPLIKCKHCDGKLTKIISNSNFQLKGSGWSSTGYSKDKTEKHDE